MIWDAEREFDRAKLRTLLSPVEAFSSVDELLGLADRCGQFRVPPSTDVHFIRQRTPVFVSNTRLMPTLFTTGYAQHRTPDSLIDALRTAGVRRLVDVRELPLSRKRGFSKAALAAALDAAHIEYEHLPALGNPKPYRELYKSGRILEGEQRYRAHLHNGSYPALVKLGETLEDATTCLLCFEASHEECHRAVIVDALSERISALDVVHLQ